LYRNNIKWSYDYTNYSDWCLIICDLPLTKLVYFLFIYILLLFWIMIELWCLFKFKSYWIILNPNCLFCYKTKQRYLNRGIGLSQKTMWWIDNYNSTMGIFHRTFLSLRLCSLCSCCIRYLSSDILLCYHYVCAVYAVVVSDRLVFSMHFLPNVTGIFSLHLYIIVILNYDRTVMLV
jgi:hypothetical protein